MLELTQKLNDGLFLIDILDFIYDAFDEVIPYNRIGFALLEDNGATLRAHWAKSDSKKQFLKSGFSQPMKGSSLQEIFLSKKPRIINDLQKCLEQNPASKASKLALAEGVQSSLTCPLISMGKPIGFLFFSSKERNTYADIHQDIYSDLANQLSSVVEKSKLYEELFDSNKSINESLDALVVQASEDALTGLWNRGAIDQILKENLAHSKRNKSGIALLMMDIDHFKQVNDQYGHPAGDTILKEVASHFRTVARQGDNEGRYGGEEFMVVFTNLKPENMEKVTERYRLIIEEKTLNSQKKR
jgi:diguanylate cyclase (GGDEF)-like protein